jgi:hypothetical protein
MKTHSNTIEKELEQLLIVSSTLQSSTNTNSKANKIGKDMLQKMATDTDELRAIVSRVEVAAEEDKFQINVYESAIERYETQLNAMKDELSESLQCRMGDTKKSKHTEMDLQAKIKGLTLHLSNRMRDRDQVSDEASPESIQAMKNIEQVLNFAPSDEVAATDTMQQLQQTV